MSEKISFKTLSSDTLYTINKVGQFSLFVNHKKKIFLILFKRNKDISIFKPFEGNFGG